MKMIPFSLPVLGRLSLLVPTLVLSAFLVGCVDNMDLSSYARMSPSAPPQPMQEERLISQDPQHEYWRPGFWEYDGDDFSWIAGSLITRPDPTAVWMPDRWQQRSYGWTFVPGFWQ